MEVRTTTASLHVSTWGSTLMWAAHLLESTFSSGAANSPAVLNVLQISALLHFFFFFFLNFKRSVLLMDLFIHVFMFPVFPNAGISLNYTSPHCDGDILKALYFSFQIHQSWANMIDEGVSWQSLWWPPTDLIDSSWSWCSELSWKIRFNVSCSTLSFNRERVQSSHQITSVFIMGKYYNIW